MSDNTDASICVVEAGGLVSPDVDESILSSKVEELTIQEASAVSVKSDDAEPSDPRVQVLRKRLSEQLNSLLSDADCSRFLRARNYNIDKAADMIEKWGVWWSTPLPGTDMLPKDAASKPDEQEEIYKEWMPHANLGETKEGHPIYWEKTGQSKFFASSCELKLVVSFPSILISF